LAFLREYKHVKGYHLVIVPKSTIPNWMNEFKKWCPEIRVVNLIANVCLTTFEGCRICLSYLLKFKWEYTIVDEAHKIKNEESQISQKLRTLDSRFRLLLTGTPL
jgi:SWI/SNF-related matrix-associated actin-dependent regulator of chromatin subfamily A member 5